MRGDDIAEVADFFSFGTNDLTQMAFGFSRDDVEGRLMARYLEEGLLPRNPFETIDHRGVGDLMRICVERGGASSPTCRSLAVSDAAVAALARAGFSVKYGARFLKRGIDEKVKVPVTLKWKESDHFLVEEVGGEVVLITQKVAV